MACTTQMEKVSSKKKNARGEAKLRLSVERGPLLVLLTITDLHGATRTLRVVTEDDNDLIPIKHPATTIEATAIPFSPDQLLARLRLVEAKLKEQRAQHVQPSASSQPVVEEASAQRQADGVRYMTKRIDGQTIEQIFDPETGVMTIKSSGCSNPHCDEADCTAAPVTMTWNVKTGETGYTTDGPHMNAVLAPMLKSFQENPQRQIDLCKRLATTLKEKEAIMERLPTAKPAEKKRLAKELENKKAEFAKMKDLMLRTASTGGWLRVPKEEVAALVEQARLKDPHRVAPIASRALAALEERLSIQEKLESTSNQTKKKRLTTLLGRKEIEFDTAMNEIAVIADGSVQDDSKELDDVSARMNEATALDQSP